MLNWNNFFEIVRAGGGLHQWAVLLSQLFRQLAVGQHLDVFGAFCRVRQTCRGIVVVVHFSLFLRVVKGGPPIRYRVKFSTFGAITLKVFLLRLFTRAIVGDRLVFLPNCLYSRSNLPVLICLRFPTDGLYFAVGARIRIFLSLRGLHYFLYLL